MRADHRICRRAWHHPFDGIDRYLLLHATAGSFFATLKTEFPHRRVWLIRAHAIRGVADRIEDR